jgi:hypothetical protein
MLNKSKQAEASTGSVKMKFNFAAERRVPSLFIFKEARSWRKCKMLCIVANVL